MSRVLKGYACAFGSVDLGRDRVLRGAFRQSLLARPASEVRMLYQHDPARPLGLWTRMIEDAHGLWVEGVLTDAASSQDVAALIEGKALDGLSIGFRTITARRVGGIRNISRVDLHEVSVVTFPMNRDARLVGTNSLSQQETIA